MAKVGRPPREKEPVVHQVKFVLYPGEDDDLIRFFAALPARTKAAGVKSAIRSGGLSNEQADSTDEDEMLDALDDFLL